MLALGGNTAGMEADMIGKELYFEHIEDNMALLD